MALLTGSHHIERAWHTMLHQGVPELLRKTASYLREERNIDRDVRADARCLIRKAAGHRSRRGLFIDCGSNTGQAFSYFVRRFPLERFDFALIEPNPHCMPFLRQIADRHEEIELIEGAAGTAEGRTSLILRSEAEKGKTSDAATIMPHFPGSSGAFVGAPVEVRTFSFGEFLGRQFERYGAIALKLDIEGAEYAVLEDLLQRDLLSRVDALYVEFHAHTMSDAVRGGYLARERAIIASLEKRDVAYRLWR